jgi:DNA helicase-2/ATP-dependent DNA helicase PcrA
MAEFFVAHPTLLDEAKKHNFQVFRRMHVDKDDLVDDKKQTEDEFSRKGSRRCKFIKHVFKIQSVLHHYQQRRYNDFLRETEVEIRSASDKKGLKATIDQICEMGGEPISKVIDFAHEAGLCRKDDDFEAFKAKKRYLFDRLIDVEYAVFQKLFEYLEGRTAYSTQHKIKGREFDRVLVVLDAGNWTLYNFNNLFEGTGKDTVRERTQKLFYVCCTRAKETLAVYFRNPSPEALANAKEWFGEAHVHKL